MVTHSGILAWEIPRTEKPGRLQALGSQRVRHDWATSLSLSLKSSWLPCGSAGIESACNAGDLGLIPGLGRFPGEGKGYPLQYSGLENSMDQTMGVTKSRTRQNDFHLNPMLSVFIRKKRGLNTGRHREEVHVKTEAEIGVMLPQAKECQGGCPEGIKGKKTLLQRAFGGNSVFPTPWFPASGL